MKQLIIDFLKKYCTEVQENETSEFVDLIMDNHKCIEFEDKQYYVPDETSWGNDDELLYQFIIYTFAL